MGQDKGIVSRIRIGGRDKKIAGGELMKKPEKARLGLISAIEVMIGDGADCFFAFVTGNSSRSF